MSWEMVKLGDAVKIAKGKKYQEVPIDEHLHRYINIEDLHGGNTFKYTNEKGVLSEANDVLIAWDGANAGKVGIGLKGAIGSTIAKLRLTNNDLSSLYLFWYLESKSALIRSQRTGATIPHVNGAALKDFQIPLPPLSTQKRIAEILDKADALRKADRHLLKHYDNLAQSLFIDLFGDPVKNEKGWEVKKLGEVCDKITDGTHQSPKFKTEGIPFLFVSNIKNNKIDYDTDRFISEEDFIQLNKRTPIKVGNILITTVGSYGNPAIIEIDKKFAFQRHIAFLSPNHELIDYRFLYSSLKTDFVQRQIDRKVIGVAQKTLNLNQLKEIDIISPPIALQNRFAEQIQNIEQQKEKVKAQLLASEHLFQALLKQAFSGGSSA